MPLLRLPFAAEGTAPDPYDTAVILPLRDSAAQDLAERLLRTVDDALLLALPGLEEVVVETGEGEVRTLRRTRPGDDADAGHTPAPAATGTPHGTGAGDPQAAAGHGLVTIDDSRDGTTRYRTVAHHGSLDAALLADRPVEERLRPHWSVTWAVPVDADGTPARPRTSPVVHAPTPSDEALGVPALLIASLPLDTTRRHAAPGPLTDFLVERAADAYAELLAAWRPVDTGIIDLVPGPLGKGELDGALRRAVLDRLPRTAFLPPAAPPDETPSADDPVDWPGSGPAEQPAALRPRDAEVVEGAGAETVRVLAEVLPSLLPAGLERRAELRTLGVARVPLTEAVDRLAGLEKEPGWWHRLYDSLAGVDPDRLSGLPVPLADGRTTIGPRQVLLPTADGSPVAPDTLARLGLKVAHPDAAHPLLEKLGALPATPRAVLTTPQVRAAVAASLDDDGGAWDEDTPDAEELADTVLALVRDAGLEPGDEPWLGALALPDEEGDIAPAGELVLPGSPFAQVMREDELAFVDAELADRWGGQPLAACGVLAGFALVRATDVVLDPDELEPREGTSPSPTTRVCSTRWTCGARTSWTGCRTPRCRPSRPRSSPYGTWTSSTTTGGRRRSPCSRSRRCGTRSPSRCASCCPTAPTRSSGPTRRGGCADIRCSTGAGRPVCARPAAIRCCAACTTRRTRPASTTNRYCGPSASGRRWPPCSTSPVAPPNSSTGSPTRTARSPVPSCTPSTARWPTSTPSR